ncbi:MAG: HAMP domain-containing sensor histidine kinase [Desulfatitalea sp.]
MTKYPSASFKKVQPNDYPYYRPVWLKAVLTLLAVVFIPMIVIVGVIAYYVFEKLEAHTLEALSAQVAAHHQAIVMVIVFFFVSAVIIVAAVLATTGRLIARLESKGQSLRLLDQQLRRTSYLSSSMELSLGFYEELKDILANIDVSAKWLAGHDMAGPSPDSRETLAQITREASRGHLLIDKFLQFVRADEPIVSEVQLGALLDDLLAFLHKELERSSIQVIRDYGEPLAAVRSDQGKLRQVFQSLLLNAVAALNKGGQIHLAVHADAERLTVTIRDNGPGIAAGDQAKIFEPFFTTKPQGTGLGLPICRAILNQLEGTLRVDSQPGQGATFTVELPCRIGAQG